MFQSLQEGIESIEGGHSTAKERLRMLAVIVIAAVIMFGGIYFALVGLN